MRGDVPGLGFFDTPMGARPLPGVRDELGRQVYVDAGGNQFAVGQEAPPNALADAPYNPRAPGRPQPQRSGTGASAAPPAWVQGIGNALVQGFTGPGRAAQGEPVTYGDAWATALDYGVMGAPMAAPEGAVRMFAGRNAATANLDSMAEAQRLLASGADRGDVWRSTGWFQGVDGQMRFEIDDSAAALRRGTMDEATMKRRGELGRSLTHDDLYAAYPDAAHISYQPGYGMDGYSASYTPEQDSIRINRTGPSWGSPEDFRSSTLHETQHAIQQREGFDPGGNYYTTVGDEIEAIVAESNRLTSEGAWNGFYEWRNSPEGAAAMRRAGTERRIRELPEVKAMIGADPDLARVIELDRQRSALERQGMGDYKNLAGEVEARNVQARLALTPRQRQFTPPWGTQDVPDDMQIVRNALGPQ